MVCFRFFPVVTCLALAVSVLASPSQAQLDDGRHIGILAPLSGPFEPLGRQIEQGVALALSQRDPEAPVVQITAVDDRCDEDQGRDGANQLVGAQVDIVVGGVCWRPASAARDVLSAQGIPFVSSGVRYEGFTDDADGPVFRLAGRDDAQAFVLVEAIVGGALDGLVGGSTSARELVLLYSEGNYGRTLAEAIRDGLTQAGVSLALYEAFEPAAGLPALVSRVQAEGASLALILAGQADAALLAQALRVAQPDLVMLAADSVMTREFALLAGEAAQGVVFTRPTPWRSLVAPDVLANLEGDAPGSLFGLALPSMAATQVALAILEGEAAPFDTVLGRLSFDGNGDANVSAFELWQWRDGLIWPLEVTPIAE